MDLKEALYTAFTNSGIIVPRNTKEITLDDVVLALLLDETKFPELLGYSASGDGGFKYFIKRLLPNKPANLRSYIRYILSLVNLQKCVVCNNIKDMSAEFYPCKKDTHYGLSTTCKQCDLNRYKDLSKVKEYSKRHYYLNKYKYLDRNAKRRLKVALACPIWADRAIVREFYKKCPEGYHVDHIVPINSNIVCGLHVIENLQYLTPEENRRKSNYYLVT